MRLTIHPHYYFRLADNPFGTRSIRSLHHWLEEGQMLLIGGSCRLSQKKSHEKPSRAANRSNLYSR